MPGCDDRSPGGFAWRSVVGLPAALHEVDPNGEAVIHHAGVRAQDSRGPAGPNSSTELPVVKHDDALKTKNPGRRGRPGFRRKACSLPEHERLVN